MELKTAKTLTMLSIVMSVICALIGLIGYGPENPARTYFAVAAILLMVQSLICLFVFCRCPWCGKRITSGLMQIKVCPHCNRNLETGLRAKGKKKR